MPRASVCRLAPTEPFIGASRRRGVEAASRRAGRLRRKVRAGTGSRPASGRRLSSAPMKRVERQRLQQVVLEQADEALRQGAQETRVDRAGADAQQARTRSRRR